MKTVNPARRARVLAAKLRDRKLRTLNRPLGYRADDIDVDHAGIPARANDIDIDHAFVPAGADDIYVDYSGRTVLAIGRLLCRGGKVQVCEIFHERFVLTGRL